MQEENPVKIAAMMKQTWTSELPPDEVDSLDKWFSGVEPFSFFSGAAAGLAASHAVVDSGGDAKIADTAGSPANAEDGVNDSKEMRNEWSDEEGPLEAPNLPRRPVPDRRLLLKSATSVPTTAQVVEREREVYTRPVSVMPTDQDAAANAADAHIDRAEDGLYVGEMPAVPGRRLNVTESRILRDPDSRELWQSEGNGRIEHLPDPLVDIPLRLPLTGVHSQLVGHLQLNDDRVQFGHPKSSAQVITQGALYEIEVGLTSIRFREHYYFLNEHRISRALEDLYEQYQRQVALGEANLLTHKLQALKDAKRSIEKRLSETGRQAPGGLTHADEASRLLRDRLSEYRRDIAETRHNRDNVLASDLALQRDLILKWKALKEERSSQSFVSTPHALKVYTEAQDEDGDKRAIMRDVDEELAEREDQFNVDQRLAQREHREMLAIRKHELEVSGADPNEIAKIDLDEIPAELNTQFNGVAVRAEIERRLRGCRRPPGTPVIVPALNMSSAITPASELMHHHGERHRRERERRWRVVVTIYVNGRVVHKTSPLQLNDHFNLEINHTCLLHLHEAPREVVIHLAEVHGLFRRSHTVEVLVPLGAENVQLELASPESDFSYEDRSGADGGNTGGASHAVKGRVMCWTRWSTSGIDRLRPSVPSATSTVGDHGGDPVAALGAQGVRDMKKLSEWAKSSRVDPNDPRNAHLMARLQSSNITNEGNFFRLRCDETGELRNEDETSDVDGTSGESKRERLIRLRAQEVPGFTEAVVPLKETDIPDSTFDRIADDHQKLQASAAEGFGDESDVPPFLYNEHANFLMEVRKSQLDRQRRLRRKVNLPDVVDESMLLPERHGGLGAWIREHLLGGSSVRPLKVRRQPRKKQAAVEVPEECNVVVRIVRAWGLPFRRTKQSHDTGDDVESPTGRRRSDGMGTRRLSGTMMETARKRDSMLIGDENVELRPFVEVSFQSHMETTTVATGTSPSWNQQLFLPFVPPKNDFSPESLQSCKDELTFHVYDQVLTDVLNDERKRDTHIHKRRDRRWLGSVKVPVLTVYTNQQVQGAFKIDVPFALLGYDRKAETGKPNGESYLQLFITVTPVLQTAVHNLVLAESIEDPVMLAYAKQWKEGINRQRPHSHVTALTQDIHGLSVLITRYIHPQLPPQNIVDPATISEADTFLAMRRLARFVAMIPEKLDTATFVGFCNLWATSAQFLQLLGGDDEEHAILLCNFFLSLPSIKEAYVVLGRGIPRGNCIFVLSKHHGVFGSFDGDDDAALPDGLSADDGIREADEHTLLWDPMTGDHYSVKDTLCPLQHLDCIFNESNIWANTQDHGGRDDRGRGKMGSVSYDLKKPGWKPFFKKSFPRPKLATYQIEQLSYIPTQISHCAELEQVLTTKMRTSFADWRPRHFTKWSRSCTKLIRDLLPKFEEAWITSGAGQPKDRDEILEKLDTISKDHQLIGLPINFPFTTYSDALTRLFNTNMHIIKDDDIEFVLAVYVHPYPNNVFAVWVYVATTVATRMSSALLSATSPTAATRRGQR